MLLVKEAVLSIKRNIKRYISLFAFIFFSVSIFSAMITTSLQTNISINNIKETSKVYDYEINSKLLKLKDENITQYNLLYSNDDNEKYLGKILLSFNPNPENEDYTFLTLQKELSVAYITFNNNTWKLNNSPLNINPDSEKQWIDIIKNFPSSQINDNQNNYIAIDGLTNYILYTLLMSVDDYNSPLYSSMDNVIKPDISYVHKFFTNGFINNEKVNYAFETSDSSSSIFYTRNKTNVIVTANNEKNPNIKDQNLLLNQQFAWKHNLKIGDNITLVDKNNNEINYKIQDYASAVSEAYPMTQNVNTSINSVNDNSLKTGTYAFLNNSNFYYLKSKLDSSSSRNVSDTTDYILFHNLSTEQMNNIMIGENGIFSSDFINTSNVFLPFSSTFSGLIIQNTNLILIIELAISFISIIIIFIIVIFFIKKNIEIYQNKIGILKALGYKNSKIAIIFTFSLSIIIFISFIIGFFFGLIFQYYFSLFSIFLIGLNLSIYYFNTQVILFVFIYIPTVFTLFIFISSVIAVNKKLLFLIYNIKINTNKIIKERNKIIKKRIASVPFLIRLSFSFVSKTISKWTLVFFISTFSILLLFLQFNVNAFNTRNTNSYFSFYNPAVKILSEPSIDQLDSVISNNNSNLNNDQYHSYDWMNSEKAKQDFEQDKLAKYDENINIPEPQIAVGILFLGVQPDDTEDYLENVFGPNAINLLFFQENEYISSVDASKLINMTMTVNETNVPMWSWMILNWDEEVVPWIKSFIEMNNITISEDSLNYSLIQFQNFVYNLANYNNISYGVYPNIFLGNHMVYDKDYEQPTIQKDVKWPDNFNSNVFKIISNLEIQGIDTSSMDNLNNFFNFNFNNSKDPDSILKQLNEPVVKNTDDLNNVILPVMVSNVIANTKNFQIGDIINFQVNILNNYVTIPCKIVEIEKDDISLPNIYCSYQNLNEYIRKYVSIYKNIPLNNIPTNYFNLLLSKEDDEHNSILQVFRNFNIFASVNDDYLYKLNTNSKNISDSLSDELGPFANGFVLLKQSSFTNLSSLNTIKSIDLEKTFVQNATNSLNYQLFLSEIVTVIINIFILFSLISIVFEDNRIIILTLKSMGYSSWKVCSSILSFYLFVIILSFPIGWILAYLIWLFISHLIFLKVGILWLVYFSIPFFILGILIISIIIIANIIYGYLKIKKEKVNNITSTN